MQLEIEKLSQRELYTPMDFNSLREIFLPLLREIKKYPTKIITIAGTNGKGETANNLLDIARKSNQFNNVAMWTSPHIRNYEERFNFNGKSIKSGELRKSLDFFLSLYPKNKCNLSFYEISFWLFCYQIVIRKPDLVILEVGLGGRLDAVNLLDANVCVLTSISRDHTEYLGRNYKEIVLEKLGILRKNTSLIYSTRTSYLKNIIIFGI